MLEIKLTDLDRRLLISGETIGKIIDNHVKTLDASKIEVGEYLRIEVVKPWLEKMKDLPPEMVNKILLAEHNLCSLDWNIANDKIPRREAYFRILLSSC